MTSNKVTNSLLKKGMDYHQHKNFKKAEEIYRQLLKLQPKNFEALQLYGALAIEIDKYELAINYLSKAVLINPTHAISHNNLGVAYKEIKDYSEAIKFFTMAINLDEKYVDAYYNRATVLYNQKKYEQSISDYNYAISVNSNYSNIYNNKALSLIALNKYQEAIDCYERAISLDSNNAETYFNYAMLLTALNLNSAAIHIFEKSISISQKTPHQSKKIRYKAYIYLFVLNYLSSEFQILNKIPEELSKLIPITFNIHLNEDIYLEYVLKLIEWHTINYLRYPNKISKKVYVIGESHAIAFHGMPLEILQKDFVIQTFWIMGCKQYHLNIKFNNIFKYKLQEVVFSIDPGSTLVFTIGEIDCRINEGIIPYLKKNPQLTMENVVSSTIDSYLTYLSTINKHIGHHLIISGIPAPNIDFSIVSYEDSELLVNLIRYFNSVLKQESIKLGFGFLDTYELTKNDSGKSNKKWHIDDYHLKPSSIQELFANHYFAPVWV